MIRIDSLNDDDVMLRVGRAKILILQADALVDPRRFAEADVVARVEDGLLRTVKGGL